MLLFILACVLGAAHAQSGLQVNTTEGPVTGSTAADGNYNVFYGIPYAGSVSGDNRFKAAPPPARLPDGFHAINSNVICAQPSSRGIIGSEDCLTLSIFTNNVTTPKPVFVFLNSEEYTYSSTTQYSYRRLVEEGLVVVKLNFRLSIFGFLCLGVPEAPGNAGVRDVIQGLQWIQNNIAGFGGNASNVALVGHGSGAAVVDLITMTPQANNLIHKAVALSGSALAPWAIAGDPVGYAHSLGDKLNYTKKSNSELAKLLASTHSNVLSTALGSFSFTNNTPFFAPCIETNPDPNVSVVHDVPLNILRSGNYNHIPYVAGFVTREGTLRAGEATSNGWLERMQANFTAFVQADLNFGTNATALANSIRQFYFGESVIDMGTIDDYLEYFGDTMIRISVIRGVRERGATSRSEVRLFEFAYRGTLNSDWPYPNIPLIGVRHGGILNYLFNYDLGPNDATAMQSVVRRFTQFAYTGVPIATGSPGNVFWPAVSTTSVSCLYYGGSSNIPGQLPQYTEESKLDPHNTRMLFWNDLYTNYYNPPGRVSSAGKITGIALIVMFSQIIVKMF